MESLCDRTHVRIEWHESGRLTTGIIWEGHNGCLYMLQYCCYSYNLHSSATVMSLAWPSGVYSDSFVEQAGHYLAIYSYMTCQWQ